MPADLPLVSAADIRQFLGHGLEPPVVVVAPDRHHQGTNGLFIYPAGLIQYIFGLHSFQRHCERARLAGARLEICDLPSLALDLDLPEDLEIIKKSFAAFDDLQETHPWAFL